MAPYGILGLLWVIVLDASRVKSPEVEAVSQTDLKEDQMDCQEVLVGDIEVAELVGMRIVQDP